jgi:glutathione S-transferase
MPDIITHSVIGSRYGRATLISLEEKAVPYQLVPLAPRASKQQPYLGLHPFGRIPVLEHDGFVLYETQAIRRYVDRCDP